MKLILPCFSLNLRFFAQIKSGFRSQQRLVIWFESQALKDAIQAVDYFLEVVR